ncbi:MAG: diacylglycerol kinase family protein [Chloroflexi bacterium]|nr:diacylglycerol kinase family protein [Chloroflexota bacterium]
MKNNVSFSPRARIRSFAVALRGIGILLATQKNAWIDAAATVAVVAAGIAFGLSAMEWGLVVVAIMAVWTAEGLNTSLELLADAVSPEYHPLVGKAKDVAAGAVLISAIGSVAIGGLVFGPHIWDAVR